MGKRVIAPVAPDFCHSRFRRFGASRTASTAFFASKSRTRAEMSTEATRIRLRL